MAKKKPRRGTCALCGKEADLTRDHIPPRGIFLAPRPKNTITILSCNSCNQGTNLDEEYFRFWVTCGASPDSRLWRLWEEKVLGSSFKRSPRLVSKTLEDK